MSHAPRTRLEQIMRDEGRRPSWLAHRVGVSPGAVSRWLSGQAHPRKPTMSKVAAALGRSEQDVFFSPVRTPCAAHHTEDVTS